MKKAVIATVVLSISLFGMSDRELANTINLAGKQRMLSQKMSKEALLIYIGIDIEKSIDSLKNSSKLFNKTLNSLKKGDRSLNIVASKSSEISSKLNEIDQIWREFYKRVSDVAALNNLSDDTFEYIDKHNLTLLNKMNEVVDLYTKLGSINSSKLRMANDINLAGKQRMLTQKIAKDILLIEANINSANTNSDLKSSIELFDKTLVGLLSSDSSLNLVGTKLPKIVKQLHKVKKVWQESKVLIAKALKNREDQELTKELITKLDRTKEEMNRAVVLYTKSINRQKQVIKLNSLINGFINRRVSSKHLINIAGKQRMLTQKLSKLALECSLSIANNSCKKLNSHIILFDKTLDGFVNGDKSLSLEPIKSKEALAQIDDIKNRWRLFKKALLSIKTTKGGDRKAVEYILSKNIELLNSSNSLVSILEKESGKKLNYLERAKLNIVNIAGRERMLTQKMTKEILEYIVFKSVVSKERVGKTTSKFKSSLDALLTGSNSLKLPKVTNSSIKKELKKVDKLWQKIEPLYKRERLTQKELALLLKVNPILLKQMDKTVSLIEETTDY